LKTEYRRITESHTCSVTDEDYSRLEERIAALKGFSSIEHRSISLYDINRKRFILKQDHHLECLGYTKEDLVDIDDVESYHDKIHSADLPILYDSEIRMYHFLSPIKSVKKKDYKLVYDYRARGKDGGYVRFLHQLALFELDRNFNSWILLVVSDVLATENDGARPRRFLIDMETRKVCLFNEEAGISDRLVTPRESEVLALVAQGLDSAEIAKRLCVSASTVNNHRQNILRKTSTKNVTQATMYLKCIGLL
jgi:DNA-binding CsgD family transcriptional regulator